MPDKAAEIRQAITPMTKSELTLNLNRRLSELRPIDLERILQSLKSFHWDTGTSPIYDDQPSIGDLREGFPPRLIPSPTIFSARTV